jgi:GGDEF domain-containing protein
VCGLGLAAAVWTLATSPELIEPACLLFLAAGAVTGLARTKIPFLGRATLGFPFVLSALLLFGLGPAVAACLGFSLLGRFAKEEPRDAAFIFRAMYETASGILVTLLAGLAYLALGGPVPAVLSSELLVPLCAYVLLHAAAGRVAAAFVSPAAEHGKVESRPRRGWTATLVAGALGVVVAGIVTIVYHDPVIRPWLLLAPLAALVLKWTLGRARARRSRTPRAVDPVRRSISHALALALTAESGETSGRTRRIERLALGLGVRMGMLDDELDALETASWLYDIDRLENPPRTVRRSALRELRPAETRTASEIEILNALSLPESVRPMVLHRHERWDGAGTPDGRAGSQIPLGARILAVVAAYDSMTVAGPQRAPLSPRLAVERLRDEAGRIFDPRVVDALAGYLREGSGRADPGPFRRSEQTAPSSERVELRESTRLRLIQRELHALYEIGRAVSYRLDLEENLTLILSKLESLIPHASAVVYLLDDDQERLCSRFTRGHAAAELERVSFPARGRLSGRAVAEKRSTLGQARRISSPADAPGWDLDGCPGESDLRSLRTALAAPLAANGRCLGVLTLYDREERRFTADERRTLATVAGHVARAIENADPRHPGYLESLTDPLTGLPNGRYLEISAADLTPSAAEGGSGFGLLAFRVHDLDRVCEQSGIAAVERLLGVLAHRLAACCAESEVPVRYGQDLFLVLSPFGTQPDLIRRWDLLLRAAEAHPLELDAARLHQPRLTSAHANCPEDGGDLGELLEVLGTRLGLAFDRGHRVVPFRVVRTAG